MRNGDLLSPDERAAVERIVSARRGDRTRLEAADLIRANDDRVLRVAAEAGTWVVKRVGEQSDERLYGPWGFYAEWVGAATVTAAGVGVSPDFLGGDARERLMVFDDVGDGLDLSQLLRGSDGRAAADALAAMAGALGRLHAATANAGVRHAYGEQWRSLCGTRPEPKIVLPAPNLLESLNHALVEAGVDFSFEGSDLANLESWALEQGDDWALIHGDPCLDNWILDSRGQPKLIDFQAAKFAPAALDGAYARAPFPTCWCVRRVPASVVTTFEDAHRKALAAAGSKLGDHDTHREHLTFATAWWFAGQVLWRVAAASGENTEPRRVHLGFRLVPLRDSIILRLDSFLELSEETGALVSLAQQARDFRSQLVERWGEPDVDFYPAFGGRPD